jgi:pimeloyl-ACP methyl ester carboxylesterase
MACNDRRPGFPAVLICCLVGLLAWERCRAADVATTQPVGDRAVFDIPHVPGLAIDADPSAWADRGFVLEVMHASPPRRLSPSQFDAKLRLAWDERGLILLSDVVDTDVHESESDLDLASGASIEVLESDARDKQHWHVTISPGIDPRHLTLRTNWYDDRTKPYRTTRLSVMTAVRKTDHGYILQALFPWDMLQVNPKVGARIGLQVHVNKPAEHLMSFVWSPLKLHLAQTPSPAITAVLDGGYERGHHARFSVAATADAAGQIAEFKTRDATLGQATLKADGRASVADIALPLPPIGKSYGPVTAWMNGISVGTVTVTNSDEVRRHGVLDMDVVATPSVFMQATFPSIDFLNPGAAEESVGDYSIHTTFYDAQFNVVTSADQVGRYGAVAEITPRLGKPFKRYLTLYHAAKDFSIRPLQVTASLQLPGMFGIDPAVSAEQSSSAADFVSDEIRFSRLRDGALAGYLAGLSEMKPGEKDLPRRLGTEGKNGAWWYGLRKKINDWTSYKYLVHVPKTAATQAQTRFPLMLFLHGSGERGNSLDMLKRHGPPRLLVDEPNWAFKNQFIIVSPQCPDGQTWNVFLLRDLLDEVMAKYPVDPDRIYLTGLSMGGFATWELAEYFPDRFAAIAPISGGGDPEDVARVKDIPTWVFHGLLDPTVRIGCAYEMVQAMRNIHARIRFTVYPDWGHNAWEPAYDDPSLYEWLLMQRRGKPAQKPATTAGTQPSLE